MSFRSALGFAALLVAVQIIFACMFSGAHSPGGAYFKLLNWDSDHYKRIATTGYAYPMGRKVVSDDVHAGLANVVFFPGYPEAARGLSAVSGFSIELSLLLIAHFSALLAWIYFFLLLSRTGVSQSGILWAVVAVLAYPSSFFMVTGYTESMFLAASLGFIFWSDRWIERDSAWAWWISVLHGWVLSVTRIVGFAVAAYPAMRDGAQGRVRVKSLLLLCVSILGSVAFFVYCQVKFGNWAVYFKLEEIGWQNHPRYFAVLNPLSYIPHFFFEQTVDSFSRSSVTLSAFLLVMWVISEGTVFRRVGYIAEKRAARAAVAFMMFYIALTGKAAANMDSMIRYTLPVYVLLVMNFTELNRIRAEAGERPVFFSGRYGKWKLALALALGFGIGIWNMYRFTHGRWVA